MDSRQPWTKIMIPLDFSDDSQRAFGYGMELATATGAEVVLHTVVEDRFPYPELFAWEHPDEEFYRSLRQRALERMEALLASHPGSVTVQKVVTHGVPRDEIVAVAEQLGVEVIVLARHGASNLRAALMGSTTEGVARMAQCAVLVLPPSVAAEAEPGSS